MATWNWRNTGGQRGRPLAAAISVCVALLIVSGLLPSLAPAAPGHGISAALPPGYEIVFEDFQVTLSPNRSTTGVAECPGNKLPIGGGASMITEPNPPTARFSQVSNGLNPNDAWAATYFNIGTATGSIGFRVWTFCANTTSTIVRTIAFPSVPPGDSVVVTSTNGEPRLRCPAGTTQAGGGVFYESTAAPPLTLTKNSSQGAIWDGIYYNTLGSNTISADIMSRLLCMNGTFTTQTVSNSQNNVQLAPGQYGVLQTLKCNGQPVAGGITLWSVSPSEQLPTLATVEDGPVVVPPNGQTEWRFRVLNHGTQSLTAHYRTNLTCIS